jgi:heme/copper-type cytochrome/quinol oxidase subunit 2
MQFDMTLYIIWWIVPVLILLGRAGLQAYRTKKKRDKLRRLEEKSTPMTRSI